MALLRENYTNMEYIAKDYMNQKMDVINKKFTDILNLCLSAPTKHSAILSNYIQNNRQGDNISQGRAGMPGAGEYKTDKRAAPYFQELKQILAQSVKANSRLVYLMSVLENSGLVDTNIPVQNQNQVQLTQTLLKYELLRQNALNQNFECSLNSLEMNEALAHHDQKIKAKINRLQ